MQRQQVRVVSSFRDGRGQLCQIVEQNVQLAGGERVRASGKMCQQPNGRWTLVR
jgi:surface antigen